MTNITNIIKTPSRTYSIGIVGATGMVGQTILRILEERNIPIKNLFLFSQYPNFLRFKHHTLQTQPLNPKTLPEMDFMFTAAGADVSVALKEHVSPNTWWIDKTSAFRMQDDIPLIVPELNSDKITENTKIIACPNCVAIPLALSLKPVLDNYKIEHCFVSTYQSVSGAGRQATKALSREQKNHELGIEENPEHFNKHIAMNIIPCIDTMYDNMWTEEEIKISQETQKILNTVISMDVTSVRVPISVGHSASVTLLLNEKVDIKKIKQSIEKTPGLSLIDGANRYLTPKDIAGENDVFINRLRVGLDNPKSLTFFMMTDNLRKGAALNGVQIMEYIMKNFIK